MDTLEQTVTAMGDKYSAAFVLAATERLNSRGTVPVGPIEDLGLRSAWSYALGETTDPSPITAAIAQIESASARLPAHATRELMLESLRTVAGRKALGPVIADLSRVARSEGGTLDTAYLEALVEELTATQLIGSELSRQVLIANIAARTGR